MMDPMHIDIEHVSKLAKLILTDAEKEKFTQQLTSILKHFKTLDQVDVSNLSPLVHGSEFETRWREDLVSPSTPSTELYKNSPAYDDEGFEVNKII